MFISLFFFLLHLLFFHEQNQNGGFLIFDSGVLGCACLIKIESFCFFKEKVFCGEGPSSFFFVFDFNFIGEGCSVLWGFEIV